MVLASENKLKKGAVLKILLPIYIGVHRTFGTYSCQLAVDNSKTVNRTDKVDTLATTLGNITVFEPNLSPGSSQKEKISEKNFESPPLCQLALSTRTFRHTQSLKTRNFSKITHRHSRITVQIQLKYSGPVSTF